MMVEDELRAAAAGQQQQHHHHHKQATQVTTVTKVVREVKHHHIGPGTGPGSAAAAIDLSGGQDYVAMPLDVQHLGPDGQPVDYVAMPLGMYPRSQYLNYSNHSMDQGGGGVQSYGGGGGRGGEPQYHHYDYEHYPTAADQYSNSTGNGGGGFIVKGGGVGAPNGYLTEFDPQSPCPSDEPSRSQSPHTAAATAAALAAAAAGAGYHLQPGGGGYDDMPDYRITPSPGGGVGLSGSGGGVPSDEYRDDANAAAMVYGYASSSPYGAAAGMITFIFSNQ